MSDIIERLHAATSSEPTVDEALRGPWLYAEAAAEITRLRAERDALAKAINDHNTGCRLACLSMDDERCDPYQSRGQRCPDCPIHHEIDAAIAGKP